MKGSLIIYGVLGTLLVIINITMAAAIADSSSSSLNSELKELLQKRKSLAILKAIVQELDSNLARVYKRSCNLNLPGFDCDSGNMIDSAYDAGWWAGDSTPGKKRGCLNPDGSCEYKNIAEMGRNIDSWRGGPGRRKRAAHVDQRQ